MRTSPILALLLACDSGEPTQAPQAAHIIPETTVASEKGGFDMTEFITSQAVAQKVARSLKPYGDCNKGDFFYAVDANRDGFRDTLNSGDIYCSERNNLQGDTIHQAFNEKILPGLTPRETFNLSPGIFQDFKGLMKMLREVKVLKNDAEEQMAFDYFTYQKNHFGNDPFQSQAGTLVRMENGIIYLASSYNPCEGSVEFALYPWDYSPLLDASNAPAGRTEVLTQLVAIPAPRCLETKDWTWERPQDDAYQPESDSKFQYQNGQPAKDSGLQKLAEILPSGWNLATMPDSESGLAMEMMFDGCCDLSEGKWFEADRDLYGIQRNSIVITGTRGGFAVLRATGVYGFEPGKEGHLKWTKDTKHVLSGQEAVQAELSRYNDDASDDYTPKMAGTKQTIVRRGNPETSGAYWEQGWCKSTVPASLAAIHSLVGSDAFWLNEGYWGGSQTFDGSDQLELLKAKQLPNGDKVYQARFK